MREDIKNHIESPEFDHLGGAAELLRSIREAAHQKPSLLTDHDVQNYIKVAEEALAAALSKIHAAKEALRIEEKANSEVYKINSANYFNTYFGDLNGQNFANMDEFNAAIKARYVKLYNETGYDKVGISGFKNDFQTNGTKFDELALAELQINIDKTCHKLLLLPFRHYLYHPTCKHTILLCVNEEYHYGPVELRQC